ncbi:hypothetical protein pdam_00008179, partial [Pocillopora damicornis]
MGNLRNDDDDGDAVDNVAVDVHVLQTAQSLVITRCCFAEDAEKSTKIFNAPISLIVYGYRKKIVLLSYPRDRGNILSSMGPKQAIKSRQDGPILSTQ